jgi:uncharacterized protein (DUF2267 family)
VPLSVEQQKRFIKDEYQQKDKQKKEEFTRKHMQMLRQKVGPIINQTTGLAGPSDLASVYFTQPHESKKGTELDKQQMFTSFVDQYRQIH